MAPKKAKSSSSKAPAAATRVNPAKHEKPSTPAPNKKRKAEAVPPAAATTYTDTYVVIKFEGNGYEQNRVSIEGVCPSEDQACAAAIRKFIVQLEEDTGDTQRGLRKTAITKGLSLKQKLKKVLSDGKPVEDVLEFKVKKTRAFPQENVDEERLLEGLQPGGDSDAHSGSGTPSPAGDSSPSSDSKAVYGYLDET